MDKFIRKKVDIDKNKPIVFQVREWYSGDIKQDDDADSEDEDSDNSDIENNGIVEEFTTKKRQKVTGTKNKESSILEIIKNMNKVLKFV